jgi:hypothetical protein
MAYVVENQILRNGPYKLFVGKTVSLEVAAPRLTEAAISFDVQRAFPYPAWP